MRNANPNERATEVRFDRETPISGDSPNQLAVVWTAAGELVAASPVLDGKANDLEMDLARFRADLNLSSSLDQHRTLKLGLPSISGNTHILTTVSDYSERTRMLALDGEKLALDDHQLLDWLIKAEKQMLLGTDNHPIFETSLENTACAIQRLVNGQISMTEVPRNYVDSLITRVRVLNGGRSYIADNLTIETPLRAIARYFLTATRAGKDTLHPGKNAEVTAFLMINRSGYSFGLWSPKCGLFSEDAFLAPDEISRRRRTAKRERAAEKETTDRGHSIESQSIEMYIRQAFDQLSLQMSPDKLTKLQLSTYAQIVWACESGLADEARAVSEEWEAKGGIEHIPLDMPVDEAVVKGLLLGAYSFGKERVEGADIVPTIDLAHDILVLANSEESGRVREEEARLAVRRDHAAVMVFAAPLIVAGLLLALAASVVVSFFVDSWRDARAEAKTLELRPAVERRRAYEASLKWYKEFIIEVSQLRRQQPVGIGLLRELDGNYPMSIDPSFFVSDLKLTPAGDVEIKGLARNKDAIATFLKSLEFASGPTSGTRSFSNLTYEIQEVLPASSTTSGVRVPGLTGTNLGTNGTAAPGVVVWSIKGNYQPMAEFAPKPKPANQPGTPPKNGVDPAAEGRKPTS